MIFATKVNSNDTCNNVNSKDVYSNVVVI
jgi:hypothetical protein